MNGLTESALRMCLGWGRLFACSAAARARSGLSACRRAHANPPEPSCNPVQSHHEKKERKKNDTSTTALET